MSRPKQRKGGRVTPKGTGSARSSSPGAGSPGATPYASYNDAPLSGEWDEESDDGELADGITGVIAVAGDAIASGHPAELLVLTSSVVDAIDGEVLSDEDEGFTWASVVEELAGSVRPETTALLYALRPLAPDEWSARIAADLAGRTTPGLPAWISSIGEVVVTGVWVRRDESGEEDDAFVVARWPTGQEMTFIANVGLHPDVVVQDALLAPMDVVSLEGAIATESGETLELPEVDLAGARASLDAAARRWDATSGEASEDWPSTRPLLRWLLSTLPEGGDERWPAASS